MRIALLALALAVSACAAADTAPSPPLPQNAYRLAPEAAPRLFGQCSREAPQMAGPAFVPEAADIVRLETALAAALSAHEDTDGLAPALRFVADPASYARQYAGYTASGRPMIYGNFVPATDFADNKAILAREAMIVCDGGATFFGVEYDIERHAVVRVAFNGGLGGPMVAPIRP